MAITILKQPGARVDLSGLSCEFSLSDADTRSLHRMEFSAAVDGVVVSAFRAVVRNNDGTGSVAFSLRNRLKDVVVFAPVAGNAAFSVTQGKSCVLTCTEFDGATQLDEQSVSFVLVQSMKHPFVTDFKNLFVNRDSSVSVSYVNTLEDHQHVKVELVCFSGTAAVTEVVEDVIASGACITFRIGSNSVGLSQALGRARRFTIKLYVDGVLSDSISVAYAPDCEFFREFYYLNAYNVYESMPMMGKASRKLVREQAEFEYADGYGSDLQRTHFEHEVTSHALTTDEIQFYEAVLQSKRVYVHVNGVFERVFLQKGSFELDDTDSNLHRLKFSYRYANLSR